MMHSPKKGKKWYIDLFISFNTCIMYFFFYHQWELHPGLSTTHPYTLSLARGPQGSVACMIWSFHFLHISYLKIKFSSIMYFSGTLSLHFPFISSWLLLGSTFQCCEAEFECYASALFAVHMAYFIFLALDAI